MSFQGKVGPSGELSLKVFRGLPQRQLRVTEMIKYGVPWFGAGGNVNRWRLANLPNFWRGFWRIALARLFGLPHVYGQLSLRILRSNGDIEDLGIASFRVVTDAGVNYLVDAFQGIASAEPENFKYHGFGSGGAAEAAANTALTTEFTTEYAVNSTRPTGSQTETSANIYSTVATFTPDAAAAVTEHGLFTATSAGTLWDRSLFAVVNLNGTGDALQATYNCTFTAGS